MTDQNEDIVAERLAYYNERTFVDNSSIDEGGVTHGFTEVGVTGASPVIRNRDEAGNMEPASILYGKYPMMDDAAAVQGAGPSDPGWIPYHRRFHSLRAGPAAF